MKKCPICATESPDETAFCTRCGSTLASIPPTPAAALPPPADQPAPPIQPIPTAVVAAAGWPLPPDAASQSMLGGVAPAPKSNVLLILGLVGGFIVFVMIIAAIAIPNLLRSKMAANEASAVGSLRTINTACVTYSAEYGGFPQTLYSLGGDGDGAAPSSTAAQLIDTMLESGIKSGYRFTYSAADADSKGIISSYAVNADPLVPGSTGVRHFFTDQSGVIRTEISGPANQNSSPID